MLYGVPYGMDNANPASYDIFMRAMERNHPDLIFLQISPENFMVRQRFLSQKSALKGVEDYDPKILHTLDLQTPFSWEELVVNPVIFDMINENKVYEEIDLKKSLLTYSYPDHSNKNEGGLKLRDKYIQIVTTQIIGKQFADYNIINKALYQALLGKHKVLLSEMSEILYRQILANNLTLDQLKDIFQFTADSLTKLVIPTSFREVAFNFLPHIFQAPKDLYMTALLKEAFMAATCIVGFIGRHHIEPIRNSWIPPPYGINISEATRIPERDFRETTSEIIEKHALLDSLLEKRPWGQSYIHNPFPYITDDITKEKQESIDNFIKIFRFNYQKYENYKNKTRETVTIPEFRKRQLTLFENRQYLPNSADENKNQEDFIKLMSSSHGTNVKRIQLKGNIFRQNELNK